MSNKEPTRWVGYKEAAIARKRSQLLFHDAQTELIARYGIAVSAKALLTGLASTHFILSHALAAAGNWVRLFILRSFVFGRFSIGVTASPGLRYTNSSACE
jgi:hypothetical protein